MEKIFDSAADWLYAHRLTRSLYDRHLPQDQPMPDFHRTAQALRSSGSGSVMPKPYPLAERALNRMRAQKWPDAYECLHSYVMYSTVTASMADEIAAHEMLGDLFFQTGEYLRAVESYILSGSRVENLRKVARCLNQTVSMEPSILERPYWEDDAAFSFVAEVGDLIDDESAQEWLQRALSALRTLDSRSSTWLAACKVYAKLAVVATRSQALEFMRIMSPLIDRKAGRYRHSDKDHVSALIRIGRSHSELRSEVLSSLVDALLVNDEMGERARTEGGDLFESVSPAVWLRLHEAARNENLQAALLVAEYESDKSSISAYVERLMSDVENLGSLSVHAQLFRVLNGKQVEPFVSKMLEIADDEHASSRTRQDALMALANISPGLNDASRSSIYESIAAISRGEKISVRSERPWNDSHPLNRFRINLSGPHPLADYAIYCAISMASSREQHEEIQRLILDRMGASNANVQLLAYGLADIPRENIVLDLAYLSTHPEKWVRAVVAKWWSCDVNLPMKWGEMFARDSEPIVRSALVSDPEAFLPERNKILHRLESDPYRETRRRVAEIRRRLS